MILFSKKSALISKKRTGFSLFESYSGNGGKENMAKCYRAIIFDLDGVLVFTDHYHYLAWKHLADEEGISFDESVNNRLRGVSRMDSLAIVLERANRVYSNDEKLALADRKNKYYQAYLREMTPQNVAPATLSTLQELKRRGYELAVGSSSKNAKFILKQVGLDSFFNVVIDGNAITHSKPNPEVFLKAASSLGVMPSSCVVMEDARAGISSGLAGGFDTIGIGDAAHDERSTYHVSAFAEILALLP